MKLSKLKLHNYRCFGNGEQTIPIDNITAFIGNNSSGKTAALLALNCLFSDKNELSSYSLGIAGFNTYKKGIQTSLMPLYLRKSQAERALEEKNKKE